MNKLYLLFVAAMLAFVACGSSADDEPKGDEPQKKSFSGTWITSVASDALDSRENIARTVQTCADAGITDIFVVVWNNGFTHYPSAVMKNLVGKEIADKYAGRDPLKEIVEEGHSRGLRVHAWFEYGFSSSNGRNGGEIIAARPQWAAKDRQGNLLTKNGFEWMNAFDPEVQDFLISLVMEVVNGYDVDGVQGDDRMPALPSTGGYDSYTVGQYKLEHNGAEPPADYRNAEWVQWRADRLTDFQKRLYAAVKAAKPAVTVSNAPSIHPWAKDEYLQDWPAWFQNGCTDLVIPQHYRYDIDAYESLLAQQVKYLRPQDRSKFYPGVLLRNGSYTPDADFLRKMIEANRRHGFTGECFWFYEGIPLHPEYFNKKDK